MKKIRLIVWTVIVCLLAGTAFLYYIYTDRPFGGKSGQAYIYIDTDDDIDSVQVKLQQVGLSSTLPLKLFNAVSKYEKHIKPGAYAVDLSTRVWEALRMLRNGRQTPVRVVIPSIRTLDRMVATIDKRIMADSADIMRVLNDTAYISSLGFTRETLPALFIPNTYEFYWTVSPEAFVKQMHKEYTRFWTKERLQKAEKKGLTAVEVSILASIVEEETAYNPEKPTIAGLYLNRIRKGIPLQADPTVKFGLKAFELRRILNEHLKIDTPYNTYMHRGLPPGPIRIPSIVGIESVLNATEHEYIYMCGKEDFSGSHNFAVTYAEHLRNAARYWKALNERGIK